MNYDLIVSSSNKCVKTKVVQQSLCQGTRHLSKLYMNSTRQASKAMVRSTQSCGEKIFLGQFQNERFFDTVVSVLLWRSISMRCFPKTSRGIIISEGWNTTLIRIHELLYKLLFRQRGREIIIQLHIQ